MNCFQTQGSDTLKTILIICPFLTILPIHSSYFYSVDALVQHTGCSANTKSQMIEYQTGMKLMLIGIIIACFVWIKTLKSIISRELTMILNRQIIKSKLVINANWPSRCWTRTEAVSWLKDKRPAVIYCYFCQKHCNIVISYFVAPQNSTYQQVFQKNTPWKYICSHIKSVIAC